MPRSARPPLAATASPDPALSTSLSPGLPASPVAEVLGPDDIRFARNGLAYRVRGLSRNLSAESLKVTLRDTGSETRGQVVLYSIRAPEYG